MTCILIYGRMTEAVLELTDKKQTYRECLPLENSSVSNKQHRRAKSNENIIIF